MNIRLLYRHIAPAVLVTAMAATTAGVCAQSYPNKPVRLIAPSSPGSGVDIVARFFAQKLGAQIKQQVVVENRAGAGANIGAEIAAKAAPDGYTLFMGTPSHVINPSLYRRLNYDIIRDFVPISQVSSGQYVVVVHPALPVKNLQQLIALAKARPGQLNFGSAGTGNATHLAAELFRAMSRVNIVHVPYKGSGPALVDLVGGQVQLMFSNLTAALPGYAVTSWYGLLAPAGTPQEIISRLNSESGYAMRAPDMKERLAGEGADPMPGTAAEFAALLRSEVAKWAGVVKQAGLAPSE